MAIVAWHDPTPAEAATLAQVIVRFEDTPDGRFTTHLWFTPALPVDPVSGAVHPSAPLTAVQAKAVKMVATLAAVGLPVSTSQGVYTLWPSEN